MRIYILAVGGGAAQCCQLKKKGFFKNSLMLQLQCLISCSVGVINFIYFDVDPGVKVVF